MARSNAKLPYKSIQIWLYICSGFVFAMVLLGGITRLTESGLSMVDWRPVTGWLPPMSDYAWGNTFDAYRASPEFQKLNFWMGLEDFKRIFWLEYLHRLLGRILGIVYLLPFVWFVFRYHLPAWLTRRLGLLFLLGTAQGALGWYMVKSGLVDEPTVSHYRLAAHLGLAVVIYGIMLYIAAGLGSQKGNSAEFRRGSVWPAALIFTTMIWGALLAGLDGGATFNTFPLMDGRFFPRDALLISPLWLNFFENIGLIQWLHRFLAITTVAVIMWTWWRHRRAKSMALNVLGVVAVLQFCLGILTILSGASLYIAWAHQCGAMILFSAAILRWRETHPQTTA
ncbi:MAG: COX15/CtaA family protein [Pseudomonadota bacterium]|nr:COX15/CtaA family protein [Pseudomonadota bacterium]